MRNNLAKMFDLSDKYMKLAAYYVKRVYVANNTVSLVILAYYYVCYRQ